MAHMHQDHGGWHTIAGPSCLSQGSFAMPLDRRELLLLGHG